MYRLKIILIFLCALHSSLTLAEQEKKIQTLYHTLAAKPTPMPERLDTISRYFLGRPYENNALGEGGQGAYDQGPLYRTDSFDCETYVDTVVAIALSENFNAFEKCIDQVRYANGQVNFIKRNHFTSLDWNPNNQKAGRIKDITNTLLDKNKQPVAKTSTTYINKPNWYKHLTEARIRLPHASDTKKTEQLKKLQQAGQTLNAKTAHLPYIPLTALFDELGKPNHALFQQIPNGAIIEIVRPNWDLEDKIGTRLDISHMGFAFRENGKLYFRHASTITHQVSNMPLIEYLQDARKSPTIKGINIQVVEAKPSSTCQ